MNNEPANTSDAELASQSLENADHFSGIVERYELKLDRYVRRRARVTNEDVQDILQDIFIRVYTHLNDFDPKLSFSSWIYRIAHNYIISWYRKKNVRTRDRIGDIEQDVMHNVADLYDAEHLQWSSEMKGTIANYLVDLPDKYRAVILLRFFEDKDYGEISDILEIPPGTVATRLNRAKKQLEKELAKHM